MQEKVIVKTESGMMFTGFKEGDYLGFSYALDKVVKYGTYDAAYCDLKLIKKVSSADYSIENVNNN